MHSTLFRSRMVLLLLVLGLLAGCRAERVVFRFQPVSIQDSACQVLGQPQRGDISVVKTNPRTAKPQRGDTRMLPLASAAPLGLGKHGRLPFLPICHPAGASTLIQKPFSHVVAAAKAKPTSAAASPWKGLLFPGGLAICVAAVIIGINLGGFLGLAGGTILFYAGALVGALGYAGPDKPDPTKPKSEQGLRPYLDLLFGFLASVLLVGGGLGLLLQGGTSYLAATLTGAAMMLSYHIYNRLKNHSTSNTN